MTRREEMERMVWAAAFAASLQAQPTAGRRPRDVAEEAADAANVAVDRLRCLQINPEYLWPEDGS